MGFSGYLGTWAHSYRPFQGRPCHASSRCWTDGVAEVVRAEETAVCAYAVKAWLDRKAYQGVIEPLAKVELASVAISDSGDSHIRLLEEADHQVPL